MNLIGRIVLSLIAGVIIGFVFYGISFGSCYGYPKSNWCENAEVASIILPLSGALIVFTLLTIRQKRNEKHK